MKTTAEKIKVMQHFEDGGRTEGYICGSWNTSVCPMWDWAKHDYRIKSLLHPNAKKAIAEMVGKKEEIRLEIGDNEALSREVQEYLFSLGIEWMSSRKSYYVTEHIAIGDSYSFEYVMHRDCSSKISTTTNINLLTGEVTDTELQKKKKALIEKANELLKQAEDL